MKLNDGSNVSAGVGGTLALEFANTAGWHLAAEPFERLRRWVDFVRWAAEQGMIGKNLSETLSAAECSLDPIIALRETIFRVGVAAARGATPTAEDIAMLVRHGSSPLPPGEWLEGRLRWRFDEEVAAEQLLHLIARDAIDLIANQRVARLRLCEGGECGWLFLDLGRGRQRRWCSMSDCGNRAKAREAYKRAKARLVASSDDVERV